jgi:hypothetical protein
MQISDTLKSSFSQIGRRPYQADVGLGSTCKRLLPPSGAAAELAWLTVRCIFTRDGWQTRRIATTKISAKTPRPAAVRMTQFRDRLLQIEIEIETGSSLRGESRADSVCGCAQCAADPLPRASCAAAGSTGMKGALAPQM